MHKMNSDFRKIKKAKALINDGCSFAAPKDESM